MKKLYFILLTLVSLQLLAQTTGKKIYVKVQSNGAGSGMINLKNRDYPNDSIAVVDGRLHLWDYYRTGNIVKTVATLPSLFHYTIDNTSANSDSIWVGVIGERNFIMTIDWGDGDTTNFSGNNTYQPVHYYSTKGVYDIKIAPETFGNIRDLNLNINNSTGEAVCTFMSTLSVFDSLEICDIEYLGFTSVDSIGIPNSVTTLSVTGNPLSGFNVSLPNLTSLELAGCLILPNSALALPPSLNYLNLNYEFIDGRSWNSNDVNQMLIYLDGLTFNAGAKTLLIVQGAGSTPTGAGLTAKASLESKGWVITTD